MPMAKMKTITTVKSHYIGEKSLSEVFGGVLKRQIEYNILQNDTYIEEKSLNIVKINGKIDTGNLLSESEEVC